MDAPSSHTNRDYSLTSAFVWLLFEYLLTLDQEVELFWGQRLTGASVLFFSNRYLPLLCAAWWTPWWRHLQSFEMCVVQIVVGGIGEYLLFVPVAAFSAMRAYALASSGKRAWGILVFLVSISPGIMALVLAPWLQFVPHPDDGCKVLYEAPVLLMEIGMVGSRFLLVLADLVVLCITWSATYRHRLKLKSGHPRISDILFRDGTIYFVAQLLLNTVYLISILVPPEIFDAQDLNSIASMYVLPATSILVTHFLLDLQQASRRAMHLPAMNTENWEKVMGSLVLVSPECDSEPEEEDRDSESCAHRVVS